MTLREFYETIGGSYDEAIRRLMNETLMRKYLLQFAETRSYDDMLEALRGERWEDAFHHAHSLKGVCLNLELGKLASSSCALCEALRSGKPQGDLSPLLREVEAAHALVFDALGALQGSET